MTAVIVLIRHWFTRQERAKANTLFMMSVPLSSVIASPISGVLLQHVGWHWMFVVEAIPAFIWALVWWRAIRDRPEQAEWMPAEGERHRCAPCGRRTCQRLCRPLVARDLASVRGAVHAL